MTAATKRTYTPAKTSGGMTPQMHALYLVLWGEVRKVQPTADRHALHRQALGRDASSKSFTRQEFRKVKALFERIAQIQPTTPGEDELKRYRYALRRFAAAIDADDAYLTGILKQMGRVGGIRSWNSLDELDLLTLEKVLIAVKKEARRRWADKDRLWKGLNREWMDQELEYETCEAIVREVLKIQGEIAHPDQWSYEDMLAVLGATKRKCFNAKSSDESAAKNA